MGTNCVTSENVSLQGHKLPNRLFGTSEHHSPCVWARTHGRRNSRAPCAVLTAGSLSHHGLYSFVNRLQGILKATEGLCWVLKAKSKTVANCLLLLHGTRNTVLVRLRAPEIIILCGLSEDTSSRAKRAATWCILLQFKERSPKDVRQ
jgi:hypothetical protein